MSGERSGSSQHSVPFTAVPELTPWKHGGPGAAQLAGEVEDLTGLEAVCMRALKEVENLFPLLSLRHYCS